MDFRWKSWVAVVIGWAATCAFAGPTGERDGKAAAESISESVSESFSSPSLTSLLDIAQNVDKSGSVSIASSGTTGTSSSATPSAASQPTAEAKESAPVTPDASIPSDVGTGLGTQLSKDVGVENITLREAIGAQAEAAATKPDSTFANFGVPGADLITESLTTPVSNNKGSFLKGSAASSSLSAAARNSKEKNGATGADIKNGKTGERSNEKKPEKGDRETVPGLDPNATKTTFGGDSGDFLSQLTSPTASSDSGGDGASDKPKEQKKEEKETPKEKAEREAQVREALSDPLTLEKYTTMADQIEKNEAAVKKIIESEPERRQKTMRLIDKFSQGDDKKNRAKKAMYFRNYLERQTDDPGLLGDTGNGISVRPTIHNP